MVRHSSFIVIILPHSTRTYTHVLLKDEDDGLDGTFVILYVWIKVLLFLVEVCDSYVKYYISSEDVLKMR